MNMGDRRTENAWIRLRFLVEFQVSCFLRSIFL